MLAAFSFACFACATVVAQCIARAITCGTIRSMALWSYSDWITYENGNPERLRRLRLHIQELSEHLVGVKTRTGAAHFPVEEKRIANLEAREVIEAARLENAGKSVARSHARFRT